MSGVSGLSCAKRAWEELGVAPGGERPRDWPESTVSGQSNPRPPMAVVAVEAGDDAAERRSCGHSETMMVLPILARVGRGADLSRERREHKEDQSRGHPVCTSEGLGGVDNGSFGVAVVALRDWQPNTGRPVLAAFREKILEGFCRWIGLGIVRREFWTYSVLR
jgi:hypothetical protein